ncbi:transposase family protein [Methylobacterium sp. 4-46]|uniref:transposase family protein n=1 Tax=Methylobacterium sp. (strain 4-46) TaxID=426117 RepID=UPI0039F54349
MPIPFAIPECRFERVVERHRDRLVIPVRLNAASRRGPDCGRTSRSVHSRCHRRPADLPLPASRTALRIEVRRFCCLDPACHRPQRSRRSPQAWTETARRSGLPRSSRGAADRPRARSLGSS